MTQSKTPENIKREWMLVEFQDFSKELMSSSKARLDLTGENRSGKFSANMGCNNMFGSLKFNKNEAVTFSDVGITMMYCDKSMDLEEAFTKILPTISHYKVEGHYLTLITPSGERLKFVAADWD